MQRFISDAEWDDGKIIFKYRSLFNEDLGNPDGAIIFDIGSLPVKDLAGDNLIFPLY